LGPRNGDAALMAIIELV